MSVKQGIRLKGRGPKVTRLETRQKMVHQTVLLFNEKRFYVDTWLAAWNYSQRHRSSKWQSLFQNQILRKTECFMVIYLKLKCWNDKNYDKDSMGFYKISRGFWSCVMHKHKTICSKNYLLKWSSTNFANNIKRM